MVPVSVYRGVLIFEDYGFYTCALDTSVEDIHIHAIMKYIDDILAIKPTHNVAIDMYIIGAALRDTVSN